MKNEREKLIEKLKKESDVGLYFSMSFDRIADLILADRKRIVEPLVNFKNKCIATYGHKSWNRLTDTAKTIDETLKMAGVE